MSPLVWRDPQPEYSHQTTRQRYRRFLSIPGIRWLPTLMSWWERRPGWLWMEGSRAAVVVAGGGGADGRWLVGSGPWGGAWLLFSSHALGVGAPPLPHHAPSTSAEAVIQRRRKLFGTTLLQVLLHALSLSHRRPRGSWSLPCRTNKPATL